MPRGKPVLEIAIHLDPDVHARVRRAARADHTSVSDWVTAAVKRAALLRDGLAAVAEWEERHGAISPQELAEAHRRRRRTRLRR